MGSSYFTLAEFACKCKDKNCEGKEPKLRMNSTLMQGLNRVREEFGKAIIVTSGYRCPAHNRAIGGARSSQHLAGTAADIRPASGGKAELDRLYELCLAEGVFMGVGDGRDKGFVHVDTRTSRQRKVWDYTPTTRK